MPEQLAFVFGCDFCRPQVEAGIYNEAFFGRLVMVLLPLAVMLLIVAAIAVGPWWPKRMERRER